MSIKFPVSRKLWGASVIPTVTQCQTAPVSAAWTRLFTTWDWSGWVKPQIDYSVAVGCNCIHLIGGADGLHAGTNTQSTINSRYVQLADYCAGLGVAVYPAPAAFNQLTGMTNSEVSDMTLGVLGALASYTNVIGCDIISEADTWDDGGGIQVQAVADRCNAIYTLVKAGTSIPCTFSAATNWTNAGLRSWISKIASGIDYLDFHPYAMNSWASPLLWSDVAYWFATYPTLDILFGEGGAPQSDSVDNQNTFLRGLGALMSAGDVRLRGWHLWAAQDQDTVSSNKWGMHDASWNIRQNIANVMRQFTKGSVAKAN